MTIQLNKLWESEYIWVATHRPPTSTLKQLASHLNLSSFPPFQRWLDYSPDFFWQQRLLYPLVPGWICLQYGYLQTSKLNSTPPIFGSGSGALEENCKHPRQPQGGRLPQSIWEERPQLDSEESTTEGSRSSCCPKHSWLPCWVGLEISCEAYLRGEISTFVIT